MRDVAVAGDLVRGVDDDHALVHLVGEHARDLAQHRRLADAGAAEQQHALPALHDVLDRRDRAEDGAADAAGEADDAPAAVADAGDAVQRALDAGAVVLAELADARDDVVDVALRDLALAEHDLAAGEAGLRQAAEVHDDLEQLVLVGAVAQRVADVRRQRVEQQVEVVGDGSAQV